MRASKHSPLFFLAALLLTWFSASVLRAQDLVVGDSSCDNTTNITSGTNSYDNTYIGNNAGADSNNLTVDGGGLTRGTGAGGIFSGTATSRWWWSPATVSGH
jgi:hypothetical protein